MEETDIIMFFKKKQEVKKYQKSYHEAKKSQSSNQ